MSINQDGNMLEHLKQSIPEGVINHHSSYYSVALEGWRRGLKLTFHNNKRGGRIPSRAHQYTLSDGETSYRFFCARSSYVSKETINISENKTLAYEYMKRNGVPIPETITLSYAKDSIDSMCEEGEKIGYPLVIKPTSMGGGKGVYVNIQNKEELKGRLIEVRDNLNVKRVIIEKYFQNAIDYRFFVVKDKVIAASKSYSSNVLGDGKNNIRELIKIRNREIRETVSTVSRVMKVNKNMRDYLKKQGLSLDSIPSEGERIFLREHGTYLGHRLNVDCTDDIDPKFKKYAIQALNSIPGLPAGSVDMIINEEENEGVVNEINSKGEIMMHVFPLEGKPRDVPKAIIDLYFPNTPKKINPNFYFEFKPIRDMFLENVADELVVPKIPEGAEYIKRYTIKGENLKSLYLRRLNKLAASLYLIGNIYQASDETIHIKIIGSKEKIAEFEKAIQEKKPNKGIIDEVKTSEVEKFVGTSNINFVLE